MPKGHAKAFKMKILAISDIHADLYNTEKVLSLVEERDPDLIVLAGDIVHFSPSKTIYEILGALEKTNKRILAITGNGDSREVGRVLKKKELDIHNKGVVHNRVGFVGFSGPSAVSVSGVPVLNYEAVNYTLSEMKNCERKVLVSHVPPANTKVDTLFSGGHVGSEFLRGVIESEQPDLVICGHVHEARGVDKIGKTTIINPGALCDGYAAMIELLESGEIRHEMLRV